jgi:hypothetical protein
MPIGAWGFMQIGAAVRAVCDANRRGGAGGLRWPDNRDNMNL